MDQIKQGEKLMLLVKRDPRSNDEIAQALGLDKSYLPKLYKLDRLPPKPLRRAVEVFKVEENYFLEEEEPRTVAEPAAVYRSAAPPSPAQWEQVQAEMASLRTEISRLERLLEHEKSINANLAEALKNLSQHRS